MNIDAVNKTLTQAQNSPLYKKKLEGIRIPILGQEQFESIPFTTKKDLQDFAPYQNLSVDITKVVQCHTTSGTTGTPSVSFFTAQDLQDSQKSLAKSWKNFGINEQSVVQFMMAYGLFGGAMMNTPAIQACGGFVVPAGIISSVRHVKLMRDFKVDTLVATPSFYLHFIAFLEREKIDIDSLFLRRGIVAGEPCSESIKQLIASKLGIEVFNHYGLCEVNAGIIYECQRCHHMVPIEDYVYVEIIEPGGEKPVAEGEEGELVVTSLKKEASPIIRYRTGDLVTRRKMDKVAKECQHRIVMSPVLSRMDTTIFFKGLKLDPYFFRDQIIAKFEGQIVPKIRLKVSQEKGIATSLTVLIAKTKEAFEGGLVTQFIRDIIGINAKIEFVDPEFFHFMTKTKDDLVILEEIS